MKMRCLIPFFQVAAVLMLGLWLSSCAGGQPAAESPAPVAQSAPASAPAVQPVPAGPSVVMASFKNENVDVSYPESWNFNEVKGNPVVQAKLFQSGTTGPNITIFCFKDRGVSAGDFTNLLLSGLRKTVPDMQLDFSRELEDGSRYEVYEGHFSSKGQQKGMKAIIAFKLEGNDCGYILLGAAQSRAFGPLLENTLVILGSAK